MDKNSLPESREQYEKPQMEVVELEEDVITTSCTTESPLTNGLTF